MKAKDQKILDEALLEQENHVTGYEERCTRVTEILNEITELGKQLKDSDVFSCRL